jgi:Tfp pilus assembly protein PilF
LTGEFQARIPGIVRDNAALDLRAGRFDLARDQLERVLAAAPRDALAHVYQGDLARLRAQRVLGDAERAELRRRARESYARAAELDPALPDPHRQLGLLHYEQGDAVEARRAFERYLALGPDAPDAARIREYTTGLGRPEE